MEPLLSPHEDDDDDDAVRPILECVVRHSSNSYTAYFGYKNESDRTISIPVGSKNAFSPSPQNRSQPTSFLKGRSPHYPNAAFSVPFNGSNLTWSLRGPDNDTRSVTANSSSTRCQAAPTPTPTPIPTPTPTPIPSPTPPLACVATVFGPKRFTRTCDDNGPTVYNQTFTIPAGSSGPYTLKVVNGDSHGRDKTSSAVVKINGVEVIRESDFSNNVASFTKTISTLQTTNQLYVQVKSSPGSTFTLEICRSGQVDTVPPTVEWLAPTEGQITSDPSPLFRVRYSDLVSAPNLATLKVLVDNVDRTGLFTTAVGEASLDGAILLADGSHTLRAEIKDQAGNLGVGMRTFRTDATPPNLTIQTPANGSVSSASRPPIRLVYSDTGTLPSGINTATLRVEIDDIDVTAAFAKGATEATGLPPSVLTNGSHTIEATVGDAAGNATTVSSSFIVDTLAPVLTPMLPTQGQVVGGGAVDIAIQYSDNHALNLNTFSAKLDGTPISLIVDGDHASGVVSGLSDGSHTLAYSIADIAGNIKTASTTFLADTGIPVIIITNPANGSLSNDRSPEIVVAYSDPQGVALSSLRIRVNGVDRTSAFSKTPTEARATLPDPLPEGSNTIVAEIRDVASNLGTATSTFTLDATAPLVTVQMPAANSFTNDATPEVRVTLSDALSGVEPTVTTIFVDDVNVTSDFSISASAATGALSAPLAEGPHVLRVVAADLAANPTVVDIPFNVDLTAPVLDMATPRVDGFTSDTTPEIWLRTLDLPAVVGALASGVNAASVRIFLLSTEANTPDLDLTNLLTVTPAESRGVIAPALADGSHRLLAVARDIAGNESQLTVGFVVDTESPEVLIDEPQSSTFLKTAEPTIVLLFNDGGAGINPALTQVLVDGVDRAASLVATPTGATLTLSQSLGLALSDGPHTIDARVVDRAGNAMDAITVAFGVDTQLPTGAVIAPPLASFLPLATPTLSLRLQDGVPSSGINTSFAHLFLDGADITSLATFTRTGGGGLPFVVDVSATPAGPLGEGAHALRLVAIDNANNEVEVVSHFAIDLSAPVLTPEIPEGGRTIGAAALSPQGTVTVTGLVVDSDPALTASCSVGGSTFVATLLPGSYSCVVPVADGPNSISVTVSDSNAHTTTVVRVLTLDRTAPMVSISSPASGLVTAATTMTVRGTVVDSTGVTVTVNGVPAAVISGAAGQPATFEAVGVPVGPGPIATFEAVVTDTVGNTGQTSVAVVVDRVPPVVTISSPVAASIHSGNTISVAAEVLDATQTALTINGVGAVRGACSAASTAQEPTRQRCLFDVQVPTTEGAFVINALATDAAGNQGTQQLAITVDSAAPVVTVSAPAAGLVTNAATVNVTGTVTDASPVTLTIDAMPVPLGVGGTFAFDIPAGPEGLRNINLLARDAAGNETPRAVAIVIDRTAPLLTIGQPIEGARLGATTTAVAVQYSDDQLDTATFLATLDGSAFTMTVAAASATATAANLSEGSHTLVVRIADRAGNVTSEQVTFNVDTGVPAIVIDQPLAAALLATATPQVALHYGDTQGVDTATLKITIDNVDRTSAFTVSPTGASGTLAALAEGAHTIQAEIKDQTGNVGTTTSSFTTDTIAPTVAISTPLNAARLNTAQPQVRFTFNDGSGSGVDPQNVRVLIDGADATSGFVLSNGEGVGTLASLPNGSHTVRVEASDRAQNPGAAEVTFLVDTEAPTVSFASPAEGTFTNDPTPDVQISFADPGASAAGVVASSIRVYLAAINPPAAEIDITSGLVVSAASVTGSIAGPLTAGDYRLRVTLIDLAGNPAEATTNFTVDLQAPSFEIVQVPANAAIKTGTPAFLIRYNDNRSGVATDRFVFRVDGVDRTARLTVSALEAAGALLAADALADGAHVYDFTVFDRAGNSTPSGNVAFVVDSIAPTAVLVEPAPSSFTGINTPSIRFEFQDAAPSSGVMPTASRIYVDGVDRTALFTVAPGGAVVASLSPTLSDGAHTVRADIADAAGNVAFATGQFTVDTQAPVLTSEIPAEGRLVGASGLSTDGRFNVTGTVTDLDPTLTGTCSTGSGASIPATIAGGAYSCQLPVTEGANEITVSATDSTGHTGTIVRTLTVDRTPPAIIVSAPTEGSFTSALTLAVTGQVTDTAAVTVRVNGQAAEVTAGSGGPSTFNAPSVAVSAGPTASFEVIATDLAGNSSTATVTVRVDRNPPVVAITAPPAGAYLRGGVTTVTATVTDETNTVLDLNGVPGTNTGCLDAGGNLRRCTFTADIPILAGNAVIVATAFDEAGNQGVQQVTAIVDNTPPVIVVAAPPSGLITNATTVAVSGTVTDASPTTLVVNGQTVTLGVNGAFTATIANDVLGVPFASVEGTRAISFTATDAAGNDSTTSVDVTFDRTPPALTISSPLAGSVVPTSTVAVTGTVVDATAVTVTVQGTPTNVTGVVYTTSVGDLAEGPLTITVRAVDAAGNQTQVTRDVDVDLGPPMVSITSPAAGSLTKESSAVLAYSVLDRARTTITIQRSVNAAAPAPLEGSIPDCPGVLACDRNQTVELAEGDNTFTVEATDTGARSSSAQVTITRDSIPPTVELTTPETVSRGRSASASATATDNLTLESLQIRIGAGSSTTVICNGVATCSGVIPIAEGAVPGDILTITAAATDRAGNVKTTARTARLTSDGVVTGTVLNDTSSLPLVGSTVRLLTASGETSRSTVTDENGRYSIPVADLSALIRIEKAGMTSADRVVSVFSGTGTVPLDARLTPLAEATTSSPVVPTVGTPALPGPISIEVPAGSHRVTLLSPQGLPNLLPPGFSPVAGFVWSADSPSGQARATFTVPTGAAALPESVLVRYDTTMRDWRVVVAGLTATGGALAADLVGPGTYALVIPDATTPPIPIGATDDALVGLAVASIPATATSESRVDPAVLPPTGGTATGSLRLDSPSSLPSGTIVQADVEETYTLTSGEEASTPKRSMDVVTYKRNVLTNTALCAPAEAGTTPADHLCAAFPITPSRTYATSGLRDGRVHIDLLSGRENARGTVGGNAATTVTSGNVRLNVAAGSLAEDTAIWMMSYDTFSPFIPTGNGITPIGQVSVDFATATLATTSSLTFDGVAAAPGDTVLLARIDRDAFDGIARFQVVATAEVTISGAGVASARTTTDTGILGVNLEGVTKTAWYVLFRLGGPVSWVTGTTTVGAGAASAPVKALVTNNTIPFTTTSTNAGYYAIPAVPGAVELTARVLGQSLLGTAQAATSANTATTSDIVLMGTVTPATITPASGAIGVEVNAPLLLVSPVAIKPDTITPANITLRSVPADGSSTAAVNVPLRFVLSGSGKQLSIIPTGPETTPPTPALAFSTDYVLEVTGLLDTVGGLITAPPTTFRTKDDIKPVYNLKALTFSFPDADGIVTVSAPNGTLPPGTEILIINSGSGVVVGLTAGNDGQVNGTIPASLSDRLMVTVTDPFGNTTRFESSKFVNAATGETAIGSGGGTIDGPGGASATIPEGALSKGVPMKLSVLTSEEYDALFPNQRPNFGSRQIGSVLKIEAAEETTLQKPIKLTFDVPENFATTYPGADARDAIFYTLKRSALPSGETAYEVVDHAFAVCPNDVPGSQSEPDRSCAAADLRVKTASPPFPEFVGSLSGASYIVLMFDWAGAAAELSRYALAGTIAGRVRRQVWGTESEPGPVRYEGVEGATVTVSEIAGNPVTAPFGVFAKTQKDGTYTLWDNAYTGGTVTVRAAFGAEVRTAVGFEGNPQDISASWGPFAALKFYKNKAHVDVLFESQEPPPPAPDVEVVVMKASDRSVVRGLSTAGTSLRIGFRSNRAGEQVTINSLDINGTNYVVTLDSAGVFAGITQDTWTPTQPGTYVLSTNAISPFGGTIPVSTTVRIIAEGGGVETDHTQAPRVIEQRTYPKPNAKSVAINIFPTIAFSEPVTGVNLMTVKLERADVATPTAFVDEIYKLSGVTANGTVIDDLASAPTAAVTGITIVPLVGLRYGQVYRLSLTGGIQDLDVVSGSPAPKTLVPYTTTFRTFAPEFIPSESTASYTTTGFYVVKNEQGEAESMWSLKHAILGASWLTQFTRYDISDPVNPTESLVEQMIGRPMDLQGEGTMVAIATGPGARSIPSNVRLYDVSDAAAPQWVGAVTLANSAGQGAVSRIDVRGERVYAATFRRGIQIVDVGLMRSNFVPCCTAPHYQMLNEMNLDGQAFNTQAIVRTIPVSGVAGQLAFFTGIESIPQGNDPLIIATGNFGLTTAKESSQAPLYTGKPTKDTYSLDYGIALASATVGGYDLAVVAAMSGAKQVLMTVNVSNPTSPQVMGVAEIGGSLGVVDVIVEGSLAYVSTQALTVQSNQPTGEVHVFDISTPSQIATLGKIPNVGGRLAIAGPLLYGAATSTFGTVIDGFGGVRSAALGTLTLIASTNPTQVILDVARKTIERQSLKARVFPAGGDATDMSMSFELIDAATDTVIRTLVASSQSDNSFQGTIPEDQIHSLGGLKVRLTAGEGNESVRSTAKLLRTDQFELLPDTPPDPTEAEGALRSRGDSLSLLATSRALAGRISDSTPASPYVAPTLSWAVAPGATATGFRFDPAVSTTRTGSYTTDVDATGFEGSGRFELRMGSRVLGRTAAVPVEPGEAASGNLTVDDAALPADGKSRAILTLTNVRDVAGNVVTDGTPVTWSVLDMDGGRFVQQSDRIVNGSAQATYEASIEPGSIPVVATAGDARWPTTIEHAPLHVELTSVGKDFTVTATSPAGPVANGTEVLWALLGGNIVGADALTNGTATGRWVEVDPDRIKQRELVIATVGRARGHSTLERFRIFQPDTGPRIYFDHDAVVGDQTTPLILNGADQTQVQIPAATTMRFEGGAPSSPIELVLGTMKEPLYQPVAEFELNAMSSEDSSLNTPSTSNDNYLLATMTLPSDAQIDYVGDRARRFGALRFGGEPAMVTGLPSLEQNFGINAFVWLDAATAGQKLVEKMGSFSVETVENNGSVVFAFSAVSNGVQRRVLSTQALAAQTWYHVAAHFRDGTLQLQVGTETPTALSIGGSIAGSTLPLSVGGALQGNVDDLTIYDFSVQPLFTFANGLNTITVMTDANGLASAPVIGTGALRTTGPAGFGGGGFYGEAAFHGGPTDAEEAMQQSTPGALLQFRQRYLQGNAYVPGLEPISAAIAIVASTDFSPSRCFEALLTGEPNTFLGWACELGVSFTGVGGVAQGVRDLVLVSHHFIQSKKDKTAFATASIGVGIAIVGIIPGARALSKVAKGAKRIQAATKLEQVGARVVADEMRAVGKAVPSVVDEPTTVFKNLADDAAPGIKEATEEAFKVFPNQAAARESIDRLTKAGVMSAEDFARTFDRLRVSGRFSGEVLEQTLHALDKMPGLGKLSPGAVEGVAVFLDRTNRVGHPEAIWNTVKNSPVATSPTAALEAIFARVKKADEINLKGLDKLLPQLNGNLNNLRGGFNHIDEAIDVAEDLAKTGGEIFGQEVTDLAGYLGRPDMITRIKGLFYEIDFKNLRPGTRTIGSSQQIHGKVRAAVERAQALVASGQAVSIETALRDEFRRISYVVRGAETAHPGLRADLMAEIEAGLLFLSETGEFAHLANEIKLVFRGKAILF